MKKTFRWIFFVLLLLFSLLSVLFYLIVLGNRSDENCQHTWSEWKTILEATTTEVGVRVRSCADCGAEEREEIPVLPEPGHEHEYLTEEISPTCTEGGYTRHTCSGCGDSYVDSDTKPLGHEYTAVVTEPTCVEEGFTTYTCSRCGDEYVEDYTDVIEHGWNEWVVVQEPTTEAEGLRERQCNTCGATETEAVDKLEPGHSHDYDTETVEPTCTEQGYTVYTCECGHSYREGYVEPSGHNYVEEVVKATCTEGGHTIFTCSACGDTYEGDYVETAGHSYGAWTVEAEATCVASGQEKRVCENCGNVETRAIEALGHDYGGWTTVLDASCEKDGQEQRLCGRCGNRETRAIVATGHDYEMTTKAPTCTEEGTVTKTCKRCGDSEVETTDALGHAWSDWVITRSPTTESAGEQERTCSCCGEHELEEIPAVGDTGGDGEEYESYIDPRIEVKERRGTTYYYYEDISISDKRGWGEPPSIWVNEDGSLMVVFVDQEGVRVEYTIEPPPEGYMRMCAIAEDGTFTSTLIGDLG